MIDLVFSFNVLAQKVEVVITKEHIVLITENIILSPTVVVDGSISPNVATSNDLKVMDQVLAELLPPLLGGCEALPSKSSKVVAAHGKRVNETTKHKKGRVKYLQNIL